MQVRNRRYVHPYILFLDDNGVSRLQVKEALVTRFVTNECVFEKRDNKNDTIPIFIVGKAEENPYTTISLNHQCVYMLFFNTLMTSLTHHGPTLSIGL